MCIMISVMRPLTLIASPKSVFGVEFDPFQPKHFATHSEDGIPFHTVPYQLHHNLHIQVMCPFAYASVLIIHTNRHS
jgi:hypothetical protein